MTASTRPNTRAAIAWLAPTININPHELSINTHGAKLNDRRVTWPSWVTDRRYKTQFRDQKVSPVVGAATKKPSFSESAPMPWVMQFP